MGLIAAAMVGGGAYERGRTTLRSMGLAAERGRPLPPTAVAALAMPTSSASRPKPATCAATVQL